jgi:hypothetical protein
MNWSEVLFVASTLAWCQAMPLRLLVLYAIAVCVTAVGKWWLT